MYIYLLNTLYKTNILIKRIKVEYSINYLDEIINWYKNVKFLQEFILLLSRLKFITENFKYKLDRYTRSHFISGHKILSNIWI